MCKMFLILLIKDKIKMIEKKEWSKPTLIKLDLNNDTAGNGLAGTDFGSEAS